MIPAKQSSDFVVETKGRCFLCLSQISPNSNMESKLKLEECSVRHYSLQSLSRCLGMDMRKVFSLGGGPIPLPLLEKVERAKLKAELCEDCASTNGRFSEAYRQLEKVQIEVTSWLELILLKMTRAKVVMRSEQFPKSTEAELVSMGKMQIVEVLREEAIQKCSSRTNIRSLPRVKIQKLTSQQIREEILNVKCEFVKKISKPIGFRRYGANLAPSADKAIKIEQPPDSLTAEQDANDWITDDFFDNQAGSQSLEDDMETDMGNETTEGKKQKFNSRVSSPSWESPSRKQITALKRDTTVAETNRVNCRVCSKVFSSKRKLNKHYCGLHLHGRAAVHENVSFKCQTCNKHYTQKKSLRRHQRTGCNLMKSKLLTSHCHLCSQRFPGAHSLNRHLNTVHLKSDGEFHCDLCREKFEDRESLNSHRRAVHVGDLMKLTMSDLGLKLGRN